MHCFFLMKEEENGLRSHAVQYNSRLQYILQTVSFLTFLPSLMSLYYTEGACHEWNTSAQTYTLDWHGPSLSVIKLDKYFFWQ